MYLDDPNQCAQNYSIEILSFDPVVLYLNNWIKEAEVDYVLDQYARYLETSLVYHKDFTSSVDTSVRTSQFAMVPHSDPVAQCINTRMRSLLGNIQHFHNEQLQLVKYEVGDRFRLHYDWFQRLNNNTDLPGHPRRPYNRLGSIFAYLGDNCTGGETFFPNIPGVSADADGEKFSRTDSGMGLLVKPKRGNAVFWNNMHVNGSGDSRVLHAGLPVRSGVKLGMNMFSYYYPDSPIVGV